MRKRVGFKAETNSASYSIKYETIRAVRAAQQIKGGWPLDRR